MAVAAASYDTERSWDALLRDFFGSAFEGPLASDRDGSDAYHCPRCFTEGAPSQLWSLHVPCDSEEARTTCGCSIEAIRSVLFSSLKQRSEGAVTTGSPRDVGSATKLGLDPLSEDGLPVVSRSPDLELRWAERQADVEKVLPLLGSDVAFGVEFPCVLPTHSGCAARVRFDGASGTWRYHCASGWWTLAEVRASIGWKAPTRLDKSKAVEHGQWFGLLGIEAGLVTPLGILLPRLDEGACESLRTTREGFRRLFEVRANFDPEAAVMFERKFAAAWTGLTPSTAHHWTEELVRLGVVHKLPEKRKPPGSQHAANLYRPGRGRAAS